MAESWAEAAESSMGVRLVAEANKLAGATVVAKVYTLTTALDSRSLGAMWEEFSRLKVQAVDLGLLFVDLAIRSPDSRRCSAGVIGLHYT